MCDRSRNSSLLASSALDSSILLTSSCVQRTLTPTHTNADARFELLRIVNQRIHHNLFQLIRRKETLFFGATRPMQTHMDRLASLLDDFRDEHGDEPDENEDAFAALLNILEAAEEVVADDSLTDGKSVDSTSKVGLSLFEPFPVDYDGLVYDTRRSTPFKRIRLRPRSALPFAMSTRKPP